MYPKLMFTVAKDSIETVQDDRKPDVTANENSAPLSNNLAGTYRQCELAVECKTIDDDITFDNDGPYEDGLDAERGLVYSEAALAIRRRIASLTSPQNRSRTVCFSILLVGEKARLLEWDQDDRLFFSESFFWLDGKVIAGFLRRLGQLKLLQRRFDNTMDSTKVGHDADALTACRNGRHNTKRPVSMYKVKDGWFSPYDPLPNPRPITVEKPVLPIHLIVGRGTMEFTACETAEECLVRIIDACCSKQDGTESEGDAFRRLIGLDLELDAEMARTGDVDGWYMKQETSTNDIADATWTCSIIDPEGRARHCVVLNDIGQPVTSFKSTKELILVLRDIVIGKYWIHRIIAIHLSSHSSK
jgi:hypothetical protein